MPIKCCAKSAKMRQSCRTVDEYVMRMQEAGLSWPLPPDLDDASLEARLFPPEFKQAPKYPQPDWPEVYKQMHSGKGATLLVLHGEYLQQFPSGMKYTRFCQLYKAFAKTQ